MKLLYTSTRKISSRDNKYLKQLSDILGEYIHFEYDTYYDKDILSKLIVESDNDVNLVSIYGAYYGSLEDIDWVHLEMTASDWKKLGLRDDLYGQCRKVGNVIVTYGRWTEFVEFKQTFRIKEEYPDIYEHVYGMLHELGHGYEGDIALVHSYLYGYDRIYSKREETSMKPERYIKKSSLRALLDSLFGHEKIIEEAIKESDGFKYFSENEVVGLNRSFVALLDKAREYAGIPFVINSGYRTPEHNAAVGGVDGSAHTKGLAADIRALTGSDTYAIIGGAIKAGIKRIGINRSEKFVHLDIDYSKPNPTIYEY